MLVDFVPFDFQMVIAVLLEHLCESKLYRTEEEESLNVKENTLYASWVLTDQD